MASLVSMSVPVPRDLKRWLRQQAEREGRTLAAYVRHALEHHKRQEDSRDRDTHQPATKPQAGSS